LAVEADRPKSNRDADSFEIDDDTDRNRRSLEDQTRGTIDCTSGRPAMLQQTSNPIPMSYHLNYFSPSGVTNEKPNDEDDKTPPAPPPTPPTEPTPTPVSDPPSEPTPKGPYTA